jgi:hypothetical protein
MRHSNPLDRAIDLTRGINAALELEEPTTSALEAARSLAHELLTQLEWMYGEDTEMVRVAKGGR